nr:uncharacterized protein LOC109168463 [Ipomoea trifida]
MLHWNDDSSDESLEEEIEEQLEEEMMYNMDIDAYWLRLPTDRPPRESRWSVNVQDIDAYWLRLPTDRSPRESGWSLNVQDIDAYWLRLPTDRSPRESGCYQAKMQVLGVEEPLMCKAFLPTLKGLAQKWFLALPSRSIRCFNEGEALKTYLARWQKEVQTIEGLDEQVAITFFMESLRAGKLFIDLHNDRPKTYVEAIQRDSHQADTKEAVRQKRQQEAVGSSAKRSRPESRSRTEPERTNRTDGQF